MTVSRPSSKETHETLGEMIDDASITAQVKLTLLSHSSTSAPPHQGRYGSRRSHAGGKAKNAAEKDLVTKLVTDIKGVKSVKNGMVIDKSK